ncbi:MAG: type II secretion system protein [Solirubrobacterales bacterium]
MVGIRRPNRLAGDRGFTLIELLVVISIISLLMGVLIPTLNMARKHVRAAVCMAALKQWGVCYHLYAQDNDSQLPVFIGGTVRTTYMESLRPYYANINKMRTCPAATQVAQGNPTGLQAKSFFGYTRNAWQIDVAQAEWMADADWGIGSFGENSWLRNNQDAGGNRLQVEQTWATMNAKNIKDAPFIGDARWNNAWPENTQPVPTAVATEERMCNISNWSQVVCYAMRRHKAGINVCFADGTVRYVQAEDLWTLRWNRLSKPVDVGDDLRWMTQW